MRSSAFIHEKKNKKKMNLNSAQLSSFGSMPVQGRKMDLVLRCVYLRSSHLRTRSIINGGIINRALCMPVSLQRS